MFVYTFAALVLCTNFLVAAVTPVGKVNGVPIFKEDLARVPQDRETSLSAFDRLILFRLAVESAKKDKLDQLPEVRHELDLVLYRGFLKKKLASETSKLTPTEAELKIYYEQRPLLRLRHLVFRFNTPAERLKAIEKAGRTEALFKNGRAFSELAEEVSEDQSSQLSGDIGERGIHNLHEDFYLRASALHPDQVTPRIESRTGIHYFQLVSRAPFNTAQPSYISYLTRQLTQDRESRFLTSVLGALKQGARIEILQSAKNE